MSEWRLKIGRAIVDVPEVLNVPEFLAVWQDWTAHRREIRKPLTPMAARKQLSNCAKMGVARAVEAIEYSIGNSWQGIFEDRSNGLNRKVINAGTQRSEGHRAQVAALVARAAAPGGDAVKLGSSRAQPEDRDKDGIPI